MAYCAVKSFVDLRACPRGCGRNGICALDFIAGAEPEEGAEDLVSKMSPTALYAEHGRIIEKKYSGGLTTDDEARLLEVRARLNEYEWDQLAPSLCAKESMLDARDSIARLEAENAGLAAENEALKTRPAGGIWTCDIGSVKAERDRWGDDAIFFRVMAAMVNQDVAEHEARAVKAESDAASLRATVEELRAGNARLMERDKLRDAKGNKYIDEIDQLERKVEELQAALEPFAVAARSFGSSFPPDWSICEDTCLPASCLHFARAALAKSKE